MARILGRCDQASPEERIVMLACLESAGEVTLGTLFAYVARKWLGRYATGPLLAVQSLVYAVATLVVAHGAGAGMDHPFLTGFCRAMGEAGVATVRFNFPYIERGRRSSTLNACEGLLRSAASNGAVVPSWPAECSAVASRRCARPTDAGGGARVLGHPLHRGHTR
jgi:hypothetical protein